MRLSGLIIHSIADAPADATAYRHCDAPFVLNINTRWEDLVETDAHVAWTRECFEAVRKFSTGGVYVNFLGDEGHDRVRAAYGEETYDRLVALKDAYDPTNLFRVNRNIVPTG